MTARESRFEKQKDSHMSQKAAIYSPLYRKLDDCVELAEESSWSLSDLDVVTVGEAGGGGRGAQMYLCASLSFLYRQ